MSEDDTPKINHWCWKSHMLYFNVAFKHTHMHANTTGKLQSQSMVSCYLAIWTIPAFRTTDESQVYTAHTATAFIINTWSCSTGNFLCAMDASGGYKKLSRETWFIVVLEIVNEKRGNVSLFWISTQFDIFSSNMAPTFLNIMWCFKKKCIGKIILILLLYYFASTFLIYIQSRWLLLWDIAKFD